MEQKKHLKLVDAIIWFTLAVILCSFTTQPKPLRNSWYSYKALVKRGYNPPKFKGRIYVTHEVYQELYKTVSNPIK